MAKGPEVKQGTNRSKRVYWMVCTRCGATGPEYLVKVSATKDKLAHKCDG